MTRRTTIALALVAVLAAGLLAAWALGGETEVPSEVPDVGGAPEASETEGAGGAPEPDELVASFDRVVTKAGLPWSGDETLVLVPRCSPVDAVLGWALMAEVAQPDDWTAPADPDWQPKGEATISVSAGVVRVEAQVPDAVVDAVRAHPRVGEPEFFCG